MGQVTVAGTSQWSGHSSARVKASSNAQELMEHEHSVTGTIPISFSKFNILMLIHYIMIFERDIQACTFPWASENMIISAVWNGNVCGISRE